jgi:hypothetical protein
MPDLDLIKQAEQGGAGPARAVRQGPVGQSRRPAARLPHPCQPRRPASDSHGEGEALTRKAVELELAGDPRAGDRSGSLTHRRRATDRGRG